MLTATARLLEHDSKRLRIWFEMHNKTGTLVATSEQVYLCVDQSGEKPRAASFLPDQREAIAALAAHQRRHALAQASRLWNIPEAHLSSLYQETTSPIVTLAPQSWLGRVPRGIACTTSGSSSSASSRA